MAYMTDVADKAKILLSGNGAVDETLLQTVCHLADTELEQRLRKHVKKDEILSLYIHACALLAASFYLQLGESSFVSSVRVGNLSVGRQGGSAQQRAADVLRGQAENMLMPYLTDRSFSFEGVRG